MVAAVVIAVGVMLVASGPISRFVDQHPDGQDSRPQLPAADRHVAGGRRFDQHIPKGYIYFAMGFSVLVEALNLRVRANRAEPVHLHNPHMNERFAGDARGTSEEAGEAAVTR